LADYLIKSAIQVIFMRIRESKLYKILYGPLLYLLDFRKRPLVAILTLYLMEAMLIWIFLISEMPFSIYDTPAIEIMKSIIETDVVLIGFTGLIATVLFTRPLFRGKEEKEFLQTTILISALSVVYFLISILWSIRVMAYINTVIRLESSNLFGPILFLGLGVTQLLIFIGWVSGFLPLPESKEKKNI